jgi:branched-chain amino acid transport system ATP-binding protein
MAVVSYPEVIDATTILEVRDLSLRFGGVVALDHMSCTFARGAVTGLIGPNGAGKTSLFNVVSGLYRADRGQVVLDGSDLTHQPIHRRAEAGLARTFQTPRLFPTMSALDNVMVGAHRRGRIGFARAMVGWGVARENRHLAGHAAEILERLRLARYAHLPAAALDLATRKRLELACALAGTPRLLLLDEPAGGLDPEQVADLVATVSALRDDMDLSVIVVEHHMGLVMELCDHVVVMASGTVLATGEPEQVRRDPAVVEAYLGTWT